MQIREVRVRNIRSFEKATLRLGPGTSLLWGDVGAGKTSLLHAIEMALFGFAEVDPAHLIRHRATTAEVGLTLADAEHEYTFSRRFHRRMRRGRDLFETDEKGTGLTVDGSLTRYPATELRQRAIDLLGFPDNPNPRAHSDLWRWAVYVPQERMRQILEGDDEDARLETVRKALGLERYRTAAENAKLAAHALRRDAAHAAEQAELLHHWESDLLESEATLRTAEAIRGEAVQAEAGARARVAERALRVEEAEASARRFEADRRELGEIEVRRPEIDEAIRSRAGRLSQGEARERMLRAEIERLQQVSGEREALRTRTEAARAKVLDLSAQLDRAQEGRQAFAVAESRLRDARTRLAEDRSGLSAAVEEAERVDRQTRMIESRTDPALPAPEPKLRTLPELDALRAEAVSEAEARAVALHQIEADLGETDELMARGVCPRCGQAVTASSFETHRAELATARERAQIAYASATDRRGSLTAERATREAYERAQLAWESFDKERRAAREARERARQSVARLEEAIRTRTGEIERAQREVDRLAPTVEEVRIGQARLRAATEEHQQLMAAAADADRSAQELRLQEESLEGLRQEAARLRSEDEADLRRRNDLDRRATELTEGLRRVGELESERQQLASELARERAAVEESVGRRHRAEGDAEAARGRIEQARRRVAERVRLRADAKELTESGEFLTGPFRDSMLELEHRLLARAKVEFDRSFGRYFAALIEDPTFVARSDPRFNPSVEIEGEVTPPEALSGGERTALALAFRLALGEVVRSLDRLNLSTLILDEPTDGFSPEQVQRMGELLAELDLPQVILVSHEAALNGVADRVIRVRKVDGCSELSEETGPNGAPAPPVSLEE